MASKIKAAIRVRPFLPSELKNGYRNSCLSIDQPSKEIYISEEGSKKSFHFDYLFAEEASQDDVYRGLKIDSMLDRAIEGYHSTIFAYGQTGSGKTHTMQGAQSVEEGTKAQLDGLIPKAISSLFKKLQGRKERTFSVSVSFLQLYNEKIFDLLNPASLNPRNVGSQVEGLRLRWSKDQEFGVENLFVFQCKNAQELVKFFLLGLKNRISSAHKLNMSSSRSHSILTVRLESFDPRDPTHVLRSKVELVDLAGSERIGATGTEGRLAKESIDINKSLFTLRQVISILAEGKGKGKEKTYVPYRDSKLTSILKQSIGGNSYSLMIACLNPHDAFLQQNLSTLTYATKATRITNQPHINDDPRSKLIADLKKQVRQLSEELTKANHHIDLISNMGPGNMSPGNMSPGRLTNSSGKPWTEYSQRLGGEQEDLPNPGFIKKSSGQTDLCSERLVESINMVRELLKSNKQLREQLQGTKLQGEEKDMEIFELTRENQYMKERLGGGGQDSMLKTGSRISGIGMEGVQSMNFRGQGVQPRIQSQSRKSQSFRSQKTNMRMNPKMLNTTSMISSGMQGGPMLTSGVQGGGSRNHFNYWNSVEINQYYMNEKGVDSMPTNFNRREVNSAQNARVAQSRGSSADRHAITANVSKRSWMSKNSQPKKFLSFYNDPNKQEVGFY